MRSFEFMKRGEYFQLTDQCKIGDVGCQTAPKIVQGITSWKLRNNKWNSLNHQKSDFNFLAWTQKMSFTPFLKGSNSAMELSRFV